jgi:hypothetical protein
MVKRGNAGKRLNPIESQIVLPATKWLESQLSAVELRIGHGEILPLAPRGCCGLMRVGWWQETGVADVVQSPRLVSERIRGEG